MINTITNVSFRAIGVYGTDKAPISAGLGRFVIESWREDASECKKETTDFGSNVRLFCKNARIVRFLFTWQNIHLVIIEKRTV